MAVFLGRHDEWLDEHSGEWVRAGIVSADQADAIRSFEHVGEAPTGPPERLTVGAEVASYLGSILALMGGALVVGRRWDAIGFTGQVTIAAAILAVGLAAGTWLVRIGEPGTNRLGGFIWAIGSGGLAMLVALVADRYVFDDPAWVVTSVGVAVLAIGLTLWRNLERPLQFLTSAVGFVLIASGLGEYFEPPTWVATIVFGTVGMSLFSFAAAHQLAPRDLVLAAGALSAFVAALSLGDVNRHLGPLAALGVTGFVILFALVDRRIPLLVLGVIGALISTQAVLTTTFDSAFASLIVALIGLAVVLSAVLRTKHTGPGGVAPG